MKKDQKIIDEIQKLDQENGELLLDLQRTRADFENYRKNVDADRERAKTLAKKSLLLELLPVLDDLDLAIAHAPADLAEHKWAQGVLNLNKKLATSLAKIGLERIEIDANEEFNPELHEAVTFEDGDGDTEIVAEELRPGYKYQGEVLRSSMVKVKRWADRKKIRENTVNRGDFYPCFCYNKLMLTTKTKQDLQKFIRATNYLSVAQIFFAS